MDAVWQKLTDPLVWVALFAIIFNFLLYRLNVRTFKILYEKPKIKIKSISMNPVRSNGMGGFISHPFILTDIYNPASMENTITRYSLKNRPFFKSIMQGETDIELPRFGKKPMNINIDYEIAKPYLNKTIVLTLTDIKERKIRKKFKLQNFP